MSEMSDPFPKVKTCASKVCADAGDQGEDVCKPGVDLGDQGEDVCKQGVCRRG